MRLRPLTSNREAGDGIVFAGNPHESVPRALFLDTRLTPLERNAWQVIR
ncbi:MAG: STY4528 family pathogenicity island replication protein, partial [Steroidobacteraceae bacterium]